MTEEMEMLMQPENDTQRRGPVPAPGAEEGPRPGERPPEGGPRPGRPPHYREADIHEKLEIDLRELHRMLPGPGERKTGQRQILGILARAGELTQRELTERLRIQPGSASEILGKMENAGWIARTPNAADRRTVDIRLTPEGEREAAKGTEEGRDRREEMFSCLTPEEKETLLRLLEKLFDDWDGRWEHRHGPRPGPGPHPYPGHGPHPGPGPHPDRAPGPGPEEP